MPVTSIGIMKTNGERETWEVFSNKMKQQESVMSTAKDLENSIKLIDERETQKDYKIKDRKMQRGTEGKMKG